mgnify:FL=1
MQRKQKRLMDLCFIDINTRDLKASSSSRQALESVLEKIEAADAILLGLGPGMSEASGLDLRADDESFREAFGDYRKAYGFRSLFQGFYNTYSSPEERWTFLARFIRYLLDAEEGSAYLKLKALLEGKDYFILTSTTDHQVVKVFPKERYCLFQGDISRLQCPQPCHDALYPAGPLADKLIAESSAFKIPEASLPRCPYCHRIMEPWVRDAHFLEGEVWREGVLRYGNFLRAQKGKKLLLLELGVGEADPQCCI